MTRLNQTKKVTKVIVVRKSADRKVIVTKVPVSYSNRMADDQKIKIGDVISRDEIRKWAGFSLERETK